MPVVIARKFPLQSAVTASRTAATGFTLVEALVATALFACVVVGAVFPTLVAIAQADRLAALHEAAVQVATNALVDEEAALAYGTSAISTGTATSRVDGLDLTITVAPTSVTGMHLVTAAVNGPSGAPLVRVATMVGPPVPPPDDTPSRSSTR
jgi:type II secretory pathway pseudopilin PulG